jgi:hypothetical protein
MSAAHTANIPFPAAGLAAQEHCNRWKGGMSLAAYAAAGATVTITGSSKQGAAAAERVAVASLVPAAGNSFLDSQANIVCYWDYLWVTVTGAGSGGGYLTISANTNTKF